MAGDREKVLDKIKKLMRHAESAQKIGSEAEAQAFAAMVQTMIAKHNIDKAALSDLDREEQDAADPIEQVAATTGIRVRKQRIAWLEELAGCVAYAHFCELGISRYSSQVWFIGRRSQAEMACQVYATLIEAAERIADKEYVRYFYECKRDGAVHRARGYRPSFLTGFVSRLRSRYRARMEELEAEAARAKGAMVLFKDERAQVNEFVEALFEGKVRTVVCLKELDPRWDLTHRPTLRKAWQRGHRWAILLGKKRPILESLHGDSLAAHQALDAKALPEARRHGGGNTQGIRDGAASADKISLGEARGEQAAALKP